MEATPAEGESQPLLEVTGLKKHFDQSQGFLDKLVGETDKVRAVDGVDFTLHEQETLAVVGESGCGKSTLGKTLLNLHQPTEGTVKFRGEDIAALSDKEMLPYRRDLQMIFQDPLASLNPRQTVGDIIKAPMEVHDIGGDDAKRTERAQELLERVGLSANYIDRYPHQFSGGQQQRIGIARVLALEPDVLIADEPVSALDVSVQAQILNLLGRFREELGLSMVFITHDLSVVRYIADRVAVMYLGEIVEIAPVEEIFENPQHPYTKSLLSAVPRISASDQSDRITLRGVVPSPLDPPNGCRFHTRCPVVIPPEDWPASQEVFESAFSFRNRIQAEEINVENIKARLEGERQSATERAIAEQIIDDLFPGDPAALPDGKHQAVENAAHLLATGEETEAETILQEAFPSPCENHIPEELATNSQRTVRCHRHDPELPGTSEIH